MKIITGYTGTDHVNAEDDAQLHRGAFGAGKYVLSDGSKLSYELLANNMIRIRDGGIMYNGIHALVENYEDVQIANGQQGITRTDVLVARYTKDELTDVASVGLVMITGAANASAVPLETDFPLYKIVLNGVNIASVTPLFDVLMPMEEMVELIGNNLATVRKELQSTQTSLDAKITSANRSINNLGHEIDTVKQTANAAQGGVDDLKNDVHSLENAVGNIENVLNEHSSQINTLSNNLKSLEGTVASLKDAVDDLAKRI